MTTPAAVDVPAQALAALARWRAEALGKSSAAKLAFIEALASRTTAQTGAVRELLDARLAHLVEQTEAQVLAAREARGPQEPSERNAPKPGTALRQAQGEQEAKTQSPATAGAALSSATNRTSPLRTLVEALAPRQPHDAPIDAPNPPEAVTTSLGGPPDLKALALFRSTWTQLSAERRLTESLARVPLQAGPLNALSLVHRTLAVLRNLSPGYLDRLLDYGDTLMWLERAQPGADAATARKQAGGAKSPKLAAGKKVAGHTAGRAGRA